MCYIKHEIRLHKVGAAIGIVIVAFDDLAGIIKKGRRAVEVVMGKVVILSASTKYLCNLVEEYLKLDDVICSELQVCNGFFTGKITGDYCHGREKLNRALEYCHSNKLRIEDAYYYADSIADIYVLERVGNPICVSPDRKLKRVAAKRNWRIIDE